MAILVVQYLSKVNKYGYYYFILIKFFYIYLDPITNVNTQGKVWIQEGEMLNLQVIVKYYYKL